MKLGFGKVDITPRVGVELCGFGPYLNRHSTGVHEKLWARAMAVEADGRRLLLISCDLIGVPRALTQEVRRRIREATGIPPEAVMLHCTHTHSGPSTGAYIGWGEPDAPYLELLPGKIAAAAIQAVRALCEAALSHAVVPCEGIGYNRVYDVRTTDLDCVLKEAWRPAKPELTDTVCHVFSAEANGRLIGFLSAFGCHPVVCCAESRLIHGDFCGVATNMLEAENPGSVGLFLQGAEGDVNSCVVGVRDPAASLRALGMIAARYAAAVRAGLHAARPLAVDRLACVLNEVTFTRRAWDLATLRAKLAEVEAPLRALGASDDSREVRMNVVYAVALRRLIAKMEAGGSLQPPTEVQGLRIGPVGFLAAPLEIFQAVKNEVMAKAHAPIPIVLSVTNDTIGYAPDRTTSPKHTYAAEMVPLICGAIPFAAIHDELVHEMLRLDAALFASR